MRCFFPFIKPYRRQAIVGAAFKLMEAIFELIIPVLMARLVDVGIANGDTGYALKMAGLMFLLAASGLGCAAVCQYYASVTSQGFGTALRNAMFEKVNSFSYSQLEQFGSSTLTVRITNDVTQLQTAVAMLIRLAIRAPFLCIGGLVAAFLLDARLAMVLVGAIAIFCIILPLIIVKSSKLYTLLQSKLDGMALIVGEYLSGVRVIRAFARTHTEEGRFESANAQHKSVAAKVGKLSGLSNPATTLVMNLAIVALLYMGSFRVPTGHTTQGTLIAMINYMSQILLAMIVLANLVVLFTRAIASMGRVREVMELEPEFVDGTDSAGSIPKKARVEFDRVTFAYPGAEEPMLKDVSFLAEPGQTVGVIGLTGSGKSTLGQMLAHFYDPVSGSVKIAGRDLRKYSQQALRSAVSVVPQKTMLFTGTILSNIRMGDESIGEEDAWQALEIAQAADFVRQKPGGLLAPVERSGVNFSGGQRQRLAIARALARKPSILILDDASSALDLATEARLRNALRENTEDMTTVIISQRISSVRFADVILVLEDGQLVDSGTHDALVGRCVLYQQIVKSQTQAQEVSA